MTSSHLPPTSGFVREPDVAHAIWYLGSLMRVLATGSETASQYALIDTHTPLGGEPPLHLHHREDEAYFVLEGTLTVYLGDQQYRAGPGSFVYLPRGIRHGFAVEGQSARWLVLLTPAGLEGYFTELGEPASALELPPPAGGPPDVQAMIQALTRYGVDVVGPPPRR